MVIYNKEKTLFLTPPKSAVNNLDYQFITFVCYRNFFAFS